MAWGIGHVAPKGKTRKQLKARAGRRELAVRKAVRAACVARDGYCRMMVVLCVGDSEWCHFGRYKRFKTRGMRPEARHCTAGSLMLCTKHHGEYDRGELTIRALTARGCDGPMSFTYKRKLGAAHD